MKKDNNVADIIEFINSDNQAEGIYQYIGEIHEDYSSHQEVFDSAMTQVKAEEEVYYETNDETSPDFIDFDFREKLDEVLLHNGYQRIYTTQVNSNYL